MSGLKGGWRAYTSPDTPCAVSRGSRVRQYVEEFAGNVLFGNQYLWEEVIQNQSDDVRAFLLRTSILDRFTPKFVRRGDGGSG